VKRIVDDYRQRLGPANPALDRVRLAVDEWGIVREWNPAPDSPGIGSLEHYYPLGDCLASARGLNELLRSAEVVRMANWAQTVNVLGAIKASRNYAVLDSVGHLLALYRAQVGGNLLRVRLGNPATVDAVAALDRKTGVVSLALVNYSPDDAVELKVSCASGSLRAQAQGWRINGPSLTAINVPGQQETITTQPLPPVAFESAVLLPAHSITVLKTKWRKGR
jgi:alpha-N-arabinofuranosidase